MLSLKLAERLVLAQHSSAATGKTQEAQEMLTQLLAYASSAAKGKKETYLHGSMSMPAGSSHTPPSQVIRQAIDERHLSRRCSFRSCDQRLGAA